MGEERKVVAPEKGYFVGAPVLTVWKLRAKKPGTSFVRMNCYRQWEGREKTVSRFEVQVKITP